jgi:hypothetical protein
MLKVNSYHRHGREQVVESAGDTSPPDSAAPFGESIDIYFEVALQLA